MVIPGYRVGVEYQAFPDIAEPPAGVEFQAGREYPDIQDIAGSAAGRVSAVTADTPEHQGGAVDPDFQDILLTAAIQDLADLVDIRDITIIQGSRITPNKEVSNGGEHGTDLQ